MDFLGGAPKDLLKANKAQVHDLWVYGSESVPRIEGLPIAAFVISYRTRSSEVAFPQAEIGRVHWAEIVHIEPLYQIREAVRD